jgi:hypothetical protein
MKIRSANLWIGAIMLAFIPTLLIDVAHHSVDWTKDVHNEIINLAYHQELFSPDEKKNLLDSIFDQNRSLGLQLIFKSILAIVLLGSSIHFLRCYSKDGKQHFLKPSLLIAATIIYFLCFRKGVRYTENDL